MSHDVHRQGVLMNAITVRNLPPAVAKAVKEKARKEKLSLNKAIIRLLEDATGAEKLLKFADEALYAAKEEGGNEGRGVRAEHHVNQWGKRIRHGAITPSLMTRLEIFERPSMRSTNTIGISANRAPSL